eukprot:gene991-1939_t
MATWDNVKSNVTSISRDKAQRIEFHEATKPQTAFKTLSSSQSISTKSLQSNSGKLVSKTKTIDDPISGPNPGLCSPSIVASLMQWKKIVRGGTGLYNQGNTCFLNSILQCLLYTPPLSQGLLDESLSNIIFRNLSQRSVLRYYHKVVTDVWSSTPSKVVSPRLLVQNIRQVGRQFRPMRQEDAHEFLRQLIDTMHEEILKANNIKLSDGKISETSFISRIFGGHLRSELKCPLCPYKSHTYNHFQDLSLEVTGKIRSVTEALEAFMKKEKLDIGNEWKCDGCKKKVAASKQLSIARSPPVLVLHLKRFAFGNTNGKIRIVVHHGNSVHSGHYVAYVK